MESRTHTQTHTHTYSQHKHTRAKAQTFTHTQTPKFGLMTSFDVTCRGFNPLLGFRLCPEIPSSCLRPNLSFEVGHGCFDQAGSEPIIMIKTVNSKLISRTSNVLFFLPVYMLELTHYTRQWPNAPIKFLVRNSRQRPNYYLIAIYHDRYAFLDLELVITCKRKSIKAYFRVLQGLPLKIAFPVCLPIIVHHSIAYIHTLLVLSSIYYLIVSETVETYLR